jgi:hypothetical protein
MKYRIIKHSPMEVDVVTEDGGIATIYHNEENMVTMYYQDRLTTISPKEDIWEQLSYSKAYMKDWDASIELEDIIKNALEWLVFPAPQSWEIDNSIFSNYKF